MRLNICRAGVLLRCCFNRQDRKQRKALPMEQRYCAAAAATLLPLLHYCHCCAAALLAAGCGKTFIFPAASRNKIKKTRRKMQATYTTPDAKKEEFRKYLDKAGVVDALTKGE
jgi:hypothetical protein